MPRDWATAAGTVSRRFWAMDSDILVVLPDDRSAAVEHVRRLFEEWESALSRFRKDSALSRLNASAGRPVAIGEPLLGVLRHALLAARATAGIFDPTMGRTLADLGYSTTFSSLPQVALQRSSALAEARPQAGVQISPLGFVTVPEGTSIDLGGIAKGMAVDAALEILNAEGVPYALISAGGDLAVLDVPPGAQHWPVAVEDAGGETTVGLRAGALATSSTEKRRWQSTTGTMHHLLDPRTRKPAATDLVRVSVHAPTCEQAEVAAKTALILGLARGAAFLQRTGLAGLLSTRSGSHAVGAWPSTTPEATA
jgi:thiamine biosynthesis lipoprotein